MHMDNPSAASVIARLKCLTAVAGFSALASLELLDSVALLASLELLAATDTGMPSQSSCKTTSHSG